jgi:DNA polymerase-4
VGAKTEEQLHRLGLRTVGDIARTPVRTLQRALGQSAGAHLADLAWGRDQRRVVPDEPDRSVGAEETFAHDVDDPDVIHRELLRLSEKVTARMRRGGHVGRTVALKVRFADFTTITRSRTLTSPTDVAQEVYAVARALYDALGLERTRIRLVGVRMEQLGRRQEQARQLTLGEPDQGWREAEVAIDAATARFGSQALRPARLVRPRPTPPEA